MFLSEFGGRSSCMWGGRGQHPGVRAQRERFRDEICTEEGTSGSASVGVPKERHFRLILGDR